MSTATATATGPVPAGSSRPPLPRLARVELRKLVDTRSGFWLLAAIVLLTILVIVIDAITSDPSGRTLRDSFGISLVPVGTLIPIVGILGVTAEFSQRTALQTFIAVPQRGRVIWAKALAILALGVVGTLACLAFAAVTNVLTGVLGAADGSWSLSLTDVGEGLVFEELSLLMGFGLGMLFASPAVAIVVYFVVPTAWSVAGELIGALHHVRDWLDTSIAYEPLGNFATSGHDWAQIATSSAVWVGIPVALGLVLLRRREVS